MIGTPGPRHGRTFRGHRAISVLSAAPVRPLVVLLLGPRSGRVACALGCDRVGDVAIGVPREVLVDQGSPHAVMSHPRHQIPQRGSWSLCRPEVAGDGDRGSAGPDARGRRRSWSSPRPCRSCSDGPADP